jgi:acyl-coenzyme A thioesterase PaaI-like protein
MLRPWHGICFVKSKKMLLNTGDKMIDEKYQQLAESAVSMVEGIKRTGIKIVGLRDGYAKCIMPLNGNINHVGIMYAGSLFTLGEIMGGIMWGIMLDAENFYPIVKEINIRFTRPATTDVTLEVEFDRTRSERIQAQAEKEGKADYTLDLDLKDDVGETVAVVHGVWQIRKMPEELKIMLKLPKSNFRTI